MIPYSPSSIRNTNIPPTRRSSRRNEASSSSDDNSSIDNLFPYSASQQNFVSECWFFSFGIWYFKPKNGISTESLEKLKLKTEECFSFIKDFINFSILMSSETISSSLDLLLTTVSFLEKETLPDVFVSLFVSNFVSELIRAKRSASISKITTRSQSKTFFLSTFLLFINNLIELENYIYSLINLTGLKALNKSAKNLQKGIFKSIYSNLIVDNIISEHSTREFLSIILSHLSEHKYKAANKSKELILREAINRVCCCMQLFINQSCLLALNNEYSAPICIENIFFILKNHSKEKIDFLKEINNLWFWKECIFIFLARTFLKNKHSSSPKKNYDLVSLLRTYCPYQGKTKLSPRKNKLRLIKFISNNLKTEDIKSYNSPSERFIQEHLLKISCTNLKESFFNLKKLLSFLCERFTIGNFSKQTHKSLKELEKDFFSACNSEDECQIVSSALFSNNKNINTDCDDCETSVPIRSSAVRSRIQKPPTEKSTSTLNDKIDIVINCAIESDHSENCEEFLPIKSNKRKASELCPSVKKIPKLKFISPDKENYNWAICLPGIQEAISLLNNVIINSLAILRCNLINYDHLSPIEVLEMSLTFIKRSKIIPNAALEASCGWDALEYAKRELINKNNITKELKECSRDISSNMFLLSLSITNLRTEIKEKAISVLPNQDEEALRRLKFTAFLISLFVDLRNYNKQKSKEISFIQGVILSILQEADEESNPIMDLSKISNN